MNNNDINNELKEKNQEMLLNKKRIDLDKAMESLLDFYKKYATSKVANEVNNQVCLFRGISPNSEQGKIFYNTITTFFFLACDELKKVIVANTDPLKARLGSIPDEEYNDVLEHLSVVITNYMSDYYLDKKDMLNNELDQNVTEEVKRKIDRYILDIVSVKMINMLKDKFMYAVMVINNNNKENYQVMENINEKTIK